MRFDSADVLAARHQSSRAHSFFVGVGGEEGRCHVSGETLSTSVFCFFVFFCPAPFMRLTVKQVTKKSNRQVML